MTDHLTDDQLKNFVSATAPPGDLLAADDHLAVCEVCRARAEALNDVSRGIGRMQRALVFSGSHLSEDDVQAFVAGALRPGEQERVEEHLRDCAACADHVAQLRAWAAADSTLTSTSIPTSASASTSAPAVTVTATMRRRSSARWYGYGLAAAALLAVMLPAAYWLATPHTGEPPELAGLSTLPAEAQARVRSALASGNATLPADVAALAGERATLMGSGSAAVAGATPASGLAVIAPVATATVDDRPTFSWRPLQHTDTYEVAILDEGGQRVLPAMIVRGSTAVADTPLARGRVYTWQVTARVGDRLVTAPAAPDPIARFKVLDASTAALLMQATREHPDSHLLLGILNLQAGVVHDAERHFRAVLPSAPGAPLARRALESLDAHTRKGTPDPM